MSLTFRSGVERPVAEQHPTPQCTIRSMPIDPGAVDPLGSDLISSVGVSRPRADHSRPRATSSITADPTATAVAVVIASAGRPELLAEVLDDLAAQTVPLRVVVSVTDDVDLPIGGLLDGVTVARDRGAAAQRNAGMKTVPEAEYIFFFDDDSVVRDDFIEQAVIFFERHPEVVGLTGRVLLDGATGEEISRSQAESAIARESRLVGAWHPSRELYGCNFGFRRSMAAGEEFDGRLPLYSWLEDHDFARRLMRHGDLAKVEDCVIVHRGVKSGGRVAHARLGYSQMMNPLYLHHKGSFPVWVTVREIVPRCGKNLVLSVVGGEAPWRRQRLRGNVHALLDALRGRFTPERMLDF